MSVIMQRIFESRFSFLHIEHGVWVSKFPHIGHVVIFFSTSTSAFISGVSFSDLFEIKFIVARIADRFPNPWIFERAFIKF